MASRPTRADHEAAVARRLEQLTAELAGVRGTPAPPPGPALGPPPQPLPEPHPEPHSRAPAPPLVLPPGRHAARRRGAAADALVPEPLRGRVAIGPAQLAVVAVLVAAGLGVTAWWVVRSDPVPVAPVAPVATEPQGALATPSGGDPADAGGARAEPVTVDVAGKVRRPGIAVLDPGSRVVDALEAAGGPRPGVDLGGLNLARLLVDGEQVLVGVAAPAAAVPPAVSAAPGAPAGSGPLVDINTAGLAELETLPEVGPVTAQAIITWREDHGGYTAVDELLEVDGIGEATLAAMAPFVTV